MDSNSPLPWTGIRSNPARVVKGALNAAFGAFVGLLLSTQFGLAADAPPSDTASDTATDDASTAISGDSTKDKSLPDIEARDYGVKIVRRSSSNRIYLFDDITDAKPGVGRILLLKREAEPIMAFRILKNYTDLKQFAGKRVRRYGKHRVLSGGESFRAIEKVQDIDAPPPTAQDLSDLSEIEGNGSIRPSRDAEGNPLPDDGKGNRRRGGNGDGPPPEVSPYDPELDAGSSPPPAGGVDSEGSRDNPLDDEDEEIGISIDEVNPIDVHRHWLTGQIGYIRTNGPDGGAYYATAGGFRYGLTLGSMIFLRQAHLQDSFALEAGGFLYKILNYEDAGDAYTVASGIATARYTMNFGEAFGVFVYAGLGQNRVLTDVAGNDDNRALLSPRRFRQAEWAFLFGVGPSWNARLDLGIDMIGLGLVLRF